MHGKQAVITIVIVVIALAAAAVLFGRSDGEAPTPPAGETPDISEPRGGGEGPLGASGTERTISAKRSYAAGELTISGTINKPTPCHTLETDVSSEGGAYVVGFTLTPGGGACAQVIAPEEFSVSFAAPEDAAVSARVNGEPAEFSFTDSN